MKIIRNIRRKMMQIMRMVGVVVMDMMFRYLLGSFGWVAKLRNIKQEWLINS